MLHVQSGGVATLHTECLHDGNPANLLTSTDGMVLDALVWRWSGATLEFYDWNDSSFKALGSVTTLRQTLSAVNDIEVPGVFYRVWTAPTGDYTCGFVIRDTAAVAKNVPQQGALLVGQWADQVDDVETDTQDIQSRLPASLVGGRIRSHIEALDVGVITALSIATDAIGSDELATTAVDEIRDAILADSTAFNGADIDAAITSRAVAGDQMALTAAAVLALVDDVWDEDVVAAHGGASTTGLLLRALGSALSQRTHNPNLNALLGVADAVGVDLPEQINTELEVTQGHGAGLWTSGTGLTPQQARDAMKLAPTGGVPAAGSLDEHLDDILTDTAALDGRLPTDPADELLQQAAHTQTQSDITALNNLSQAQAQAAADAALQAKGYTAARAPLLDFLDTSVVSVLNAVNALNDLTATQVTAAVWEAIASSHNIPGSMGALLNAAGGTGLVDWSVAEREQIRDALGVDGVKTPSTSGKVQDIQTRLPVVLVGGRMDSNVGNMQTDTLDAAALASDAVAEIQSGLATGVDLSRALGLLHENTLIDNTTFDVARQQLTARFRIFDSKVATEAATKGGVGEGEIATFTATTTYVAPGMMETFRMVIEP